MGVNVGSLLQMGQQALLANQTAIQVVGNNIANVNTVGYSRQTTRFEAAHALNGQVGTGVYAAEVMRNFDRFVERSYLEKSSLSNRWAMEYQMQLSIDGLFNEANSQGINSQMSKFFNSWQDVASNPSSPPVREALLADSQNLTKVLRESQEFMRSMETRINNEIDAEVTKINELIERIANLNREINIQDEPGKNNANALLDQRDAAVRELATHLDVDVVDRGSGNYILLTKEGHTLVDKENAFRLETRGPDATYYKAAGSDEGFDGQVRFSGKSYHEFTLSVVSGGGVGGAGAAQFKVSLDGGATWLADEQGNTLLFNAETSANAVNVAGLEIYFDPGAAPMNAGDSFVVTPKTSVYWVSPTGDSMNISPQKFANGQENGRRLSGGTLTGLMNFRDYQIGHYQERLNTLAKTMIWEVNRLHSQGVGLDKSTFMQGSYDVRHSGVALGNPSSGLAFGDKLQKGNVTFYVYDAQTGEAVEGKALDFTGLGNPPAGANFDPSVHSLEDVRDAINAAFAGPPATLAATIQNNKLSLTAADGYTFAAGGDTSGLLAGLGLNTFFEGSSCVDMAVRTELVQDRSLICAAAINGAGEGNSGDNVTALGIADLINQEVDIPATGLDRPTKTTLAKYYSALVGLVGSDTLSAKTQGQYELTLANDLDERQASVAGVNLDEELASLIKFQNTYKAAAKLINTADEMFQTVLGLKN